MKIVLTRKGVIRRMNLIDRIKKFLGFRVNVWNHTVLHYEIEGGTT